MKRNIPLLIAALASVSIVTVISCSKDDIDVPVPGPGPVIIEIGERSFETLGTDTLAVHAGVPAAVRFSTTPKDLPLLDNASVSICTEWHRPYEHASAGEISMLQDSTWYVDVTFNDDARRGDAICLSFTHKDTVMYSSPLYLDISSDRVFAEVTGSDTIIFYEGESPMIHLYTNPWNLPALDSVSVYCENDSIYPYAGIGGMKLEKDNTWTVSLHLEYGMENGDIVRLGFADSTGTVFTQPIVLQQLDGERPEGCAIEILSGPVSAYENGGTAQVRIRTIPWNILFETDARLTMTDTTGVERNTFQLTAPQFVPEDSTWTIGATLQSGTSMPARIGIEYQDSMYLSPAFEIKKINISLISVKVAGTALTKSSRTYTGVMPCVTDFTNLKIAVSNSCDSITVNGMKLEDDASLDFTEPVILTAWLYGLSKDFTVDVHNTGLPVVRIKTPKTINSKIEWTDGCTIRIELPDGTVDLTDSLEMRGRGNNTWTFDKKPYALRLYDRTKVLGMPKHRRWILLANYKDRTLMRNDATFWLSKHTGLNYTIHGQFVELELNGKHVGNYYLCEQAKIDEHRINISEPDAQNPENSGYLVEIDMYYDDDKSALKNRGVDTKFFGFHSKSFNIPYQFKQPDREEMTQEAMDYFKGRINAFEAVLKNDTKVANHEYEDLIDVDQAIDYALLNELAGNHDFYNTYPAAGPHSTYMYLDAADPEGKLCYGPGWDFDYHTYMPSRSTGWIGLNAHKENSGGWGWGYTPNDDYYYYFMLKDPKFKERLVERWNEQKATFKELTVYIDSMADYLRESEAANYKVWGAIKNYTDENEDQTLSFQNAIEKMKKGFLQRWEWINNNIEKL